MKISRSGRAALWIVALVSALATAGVLALLNNVATRKHEGQTSIVRLAPIDETAPDALARADHLPGRFCRR